MTAAMYEWNELEGMHDRFALGCGRDCWVMLLDGQWEIAFVRPDSGWLDGNRAIGRIFRILGPCIFPTDNWFGGALTEADIIVSSALPLDSLDELSQNGSAVATLIHEFGHALGMDHEDDVPAVMRSSGISGRLGRRNVHGTLRPGGATETVMPDDAAFAYRFHGYSSCGAMDPVVSPWGWDSDRREVLLINRKVAEQEKCPGENITVGVGVGNKGRMRIPRDNPASIAIAFSTDRNINKYDHIVRRGNFWGGSGFFAFYPWTVRVPWGLRAGSKYNVGAITDIDERLYEADEFNNATLLGVRVFIKHPNQCR